MTTDTDRWTVYVFAEAFELRGQRLVCTTGHLATVLLTLLDEAKLIGYGWIDPHAQGHHAPLPGQEEPPGICQLMQAAQLAGIRWPADLCHDEPAEAPGAPAGRAPAGALYPLPVELPPTSAEVLADALSALRREIVAALRQDWKKLRTALRRR